MRPAIMLRRIRRRIVWRRKQAAAKLTGSRYYGGTGTIHSTTHVDIEVGPGGTVVSCWYRCQMLPFQVTSVSAARALEMRSAYASPDNAGKITGVEVQDLPHPNQEHPGER
jgi:hypothetical protein